MLLPLIAVFVVSCRSSKSVQTSLVKTDSSAYHEVQRLTKVNTLLEEQNENLQHTLKETIENYEKQITDSSAVRIEYNEPDTAHLKNKVEFLNGQLQSASGNLKSVSVTNKSLQKEISTRQQTIDSLMNSLITIKKNDSAIQKQTERQSIELTKAEKSKNKDIKTGIPFWFWIIFCAGIAATWYVRGKWPKWKLNLFG